MVIAEPIKGDTESPSEKRSREAMAGIGYIKIPVHRGGKVAGYALVDDDYDGEWLSGFKWYLHINGYVYRRRYKSEYAVRLSSGQYINPKQQNTPIYLQQIVASSQLVAKSANNRSALWAFHVNGDKLDNRSCNVRLVTPKLNAILRKAPNGGLATSRTNRTGYRGVSGCVEYKDGKVVKIYKRWYVAKRITGTGKNEWFGSPEEAALAYNYYSFKKYGDRAVLNKIPGDGE